MIYLAYHIPWICTRKGKKPTDDVMNIAYGKKSTYDILDISCKYTTHP